MKRYPIVAMLALTIVGASVLLSRSRADNAAPAEPQVRELLKRIETLEARVAELERGQPRLLITQPAPAYQALPYGPGVPKGWTPREFNGQVYYDILLGKPAHGK